jgi:hypothetical protein
LPDEAVVVSVKIKLAVAVFAAGANVLVTCVVPLLVHPLTHPNDPAASYCNDDAVLVQGVPPPPPLGIVNPPLCASAGVASSSSGN